MVFVLVVKVVVTTEYKKIKVTWQTRTHLKSLTLGL
jgi:hypothetical protein